MKKKLISLFRKRRKFTFFIILVSFFLFILFYRIGSFFLDSKKLGNENVRKLRTISIVKLQKKNEDLKLSFLGKVFPKSEFFITAEIQGAAIVRDILFREGDKIEQNQILMNLDQTFVKNEYFNLYKVRAQNSGIISDVYVDVGDKVIAGNPLFKIVDINKVKVVIDIPEKHLNKIKKGQKTIVQIKNLTQENEENNTFIAKIDYFNPVSSFEKGKNIQAISYLDNIDLRIKSGFFVDVEIFVGKSDLLLIPIYSLIFESNAYSVYVYEPKTNQVFLREVKIGNLLYHKFVEILEGLQEGEFILTRGQSFVFDGEKVILDNDIKE